MPNYRRKCKLSECGVEFETNHPGKVYHTPACKTRAEIRRKQVNGPVSTAEEPEASTETQNERELSRNLIACRSARSRDATKLREAQRLLRETEDHVTQLQSLHRLARQVEDAPAPDWLEAGADTRGNGRRGTLVAAFSDFHVGEVVRPEEMNWYNAYNPEIAEQRVRRFFERTILVAREYLQGVDYDGIVVPSLGDTISGDIHDEFRETNELSNYEAAPIVVPWLVQGLGELADEFGRVHVPCVPGNHPRDSRKPRYKKRSAHNADTLVMNLVASALKHDDRITFDVPAGISTTFNVYDTTFRIEHGDEAKGGGGIQGAMLPIALRTHRIRKQAEAEGQPFDVMLIGHWHQLMSMPAKGFVVNGSGKGYDEYARAKGFEPEPPQQALLVVTPEHGITVQAPLFVGKRKNEGW